MIDELSLDCFEFFRFWLFFWIKFFDTLRILIHKFSWWITKGYIIWAIRKSLNWHTVDSLIFVLITIKVIWQKNIFQKWLLKFVLLNILSLWNSLLNIKAKFEISTPLFYRVSTYKFYCWNCTYNILKWSQWSFATIVSSKSTNLEMLEILSIFVKFKTNF